MNARAHWVNTEPDEGAPHALLERIALHIPPESIDEIWLFPTRRAGGLESTVFVVAAFGEDPERRRVATAHFAVTRDKKGKPQVTERLEEHALAPAGALGRVVDGVLRRLGDEVARAPRAERIGRDPARWRALIMELGGPPGGGAVDGETREVAAAETANASETATEVAAAMTAAVEAATAAEAETATDTNGNENGDGEPREQRMV